MDHTIVFLKSPYKMEFYVINPQSQVKSLTFLETAGILEAKSTEASYNLPDTHFTQVQSSLNEFEKDFLNSSADVVASTEKADSITKQANKFLRNLKTLSKNPFVKKACANLKQMVENGIYTTLPNEIKKIRLKLEKKQITYAQAENILLIIAGKYDALESEEDEKTLEVSELSFNIEPDIVISETFIK